MKNLTINEKQWDVIRSMLLSDATIDISQVIVYACRYKFYNELPDKIYDDTPEYALFYGLFFE